MFASDLQFFRFQMPRFQAELIQPVVYFNLSALLFTCRDKKVFQGKNSFHNSFIFNVYQGMEWCLQ
jgi:hypothetical protein